MATPASIDDGGANPQPNGSLALPFQSLVQTNFNHSITEKLNSGNDLFWKS